MVAGALFISSSTEQSRPATHHKRLLTGLQCGSFTSPQTEHLGDGVGHHQASLPNDHQKRLEFLKLLVFRGRHRV